MLSLDTLITSYGGSGLNMLVAYAGQYINVRNKLWDVCLCHSMFVLMDLPTLVIVARPEDAFLSMQQRGIAELNAYKITAEHGSLAKAMEGYILAWTQRAEASLVDETQPPVRIVKYEHLWEYKKEVCSYLNIPSEQFPKYIPRSSRGQFHPDLSAANMLYAELPPWR